MNKRAKAYLDKVSPTYIENWPAALCQLSMAQVDIPLTLDQAGSLGSSISEWGELFGGYDDAGPWLIPLLDEACSKFPNGGFVRLGSRSPKDSFFGHKNEFRCQTGEDAYRTLTDCSERMSDDLHLAIMCEYPPHIFVRQWVEIQPWAEFRCFQRDGALIGVTQYDCLHNEHHPEIARDHGAIQWAIQEFSRDFRRANVLPDVVYDVFLTVRRNPNAVEWEPKLLEINPFFEMTYPGLFDWRNGGDFDYTFRYVGADGQPARNAL